MTYWGQAFSLHPRVRLAKPFLLGVVVSCWEASFETLAMGCGPTHLQLSQSLLWWVSLGWNLPIMLGLDSVSRIKEIGAWTIICTATNIQPSLKFCSHISPRVSVMHTNGDCIILDSSLRITKRAHRLSNV